MRSSCYLQPACWSEVCSCSRLSYGRAGAETRSLRLGFLPVAIGTVICAHLAGRAIGHAGARIVEAEGVDCCWSRHCRDVGAARLSARVIATVAVAALGPGPAFVPTPTTALSNAEHKEAGIASGVVNTP